MRKTVCEFFAGVGGFRVGLERSTQDTSYEPWDTVFANQWEPSKKRQDAFECYKAHFGSQGGICSNVDINAVDKKNDIPPHTLLVGGFPCQDYSVAATGAQGIKGKKGVLWWDIYDTLEAQRPPFVLLENDDRLLKSPASQRGRELKALTLLFDYLINHYAQREFYYFDFGISTEQHGSILNRGLVQQKCRLGGRGILYPIYELKIES